MIKLMYKENIFSMNAVSKYFFKKYLIQMYSTVQTKTQNEMFMANSTLINTMFILNRIPLLQYNTVFMIITQIKQISANHCSIKKFKV